MITVTPLPETNPRVKMHFEFERKTTNWHAWLNGYLPAKLEEIRGLR